MLNRPSRTKPSSVMPVRRAREELGRIVGMTGGDGPVNDVRDGIARQIVPDAQDIAAARPQDAMALSVASDLIGIEHDAELADRGVERLACERQREGVRLPPGDPSRLQALRRRFEHRSAQIRRDDG